MNGNSNVLFGSVTVIVGVLSYPDPGSVIRMAKIFSSATNALARAVAPVRIQEEVCSASLGNTAHLPVRWGLPNASAFQPEKLSTTAAGVSTPLTVQSTPFSEVTTKL